MTYRRGRHTYIGGTIPCFNVMLLCARYGPHSMKVARPRMAETYPMSSRLTLIGGDPEEQGPKVCMLPCGENIAIG